MRKFVQYRAAPSATEARRLFVYVHDDGAVRELTLEEGEYLATAFHRAGGRPYIKDRYESRTPTGSVRGFLLREELPEHLR
jgi:hypothetical protein